MRQHICRLRRLAVGVGSAVIGSGAHMAMVAMVDNASGIGKSFMK